MRVPVENIWFNAWWEAGRPAARIRSRLERTFPQRVLKGNPPGAATPPDEVTAMVKECKVAIVVIDKNWTSRPNRYRRWFDNPRHTVRLAIGAALKRQVQVIPVLLEGVSIPTGQLPADLAELCQKLPVRIRDAYFDEDVERLIRRVAEFVPPRREPEKLPERPLKQPAFDVFLCYNHDDADAVRTIARRLKQRRIEPWLDIEQLPPGARFASLLGDIIEQIASAAVFFGNAGIGLWQDHEVGSLLEELVHRGCPVIPVILSDCVKDPQIPFPLRSLVRVDFRQREPDPLDQLIWGITHKRTPHR